MLHARDLPPDQAEWTPLLTAAMGTPDPYGRQLDGMGGGVSSLSKVCVLAPSQRPGVDVDYTFVQVMIKEARLDLSGNCGNMSSAVGPFAVDEGIVAPRGDTASVNILNTNTGKMIRAMFPVEGGRTRYDGDLVIPGVSGSGAPIRLDFLDPGGATTGRLLPTGRALDRLDVPGMAAVEASMVDAANATVFVRANDVGLTGLELPEELERRRGVLALLEMIRREASVEMGIAADAARAGRITTVPFLCLVRPALDSPTVSGQMVPGEEVDLVVRVISNGQPHRALPVTVSLCTAVAAEIDGTVVSEAAASARREGSLRVAMPSGVLDVEARVRWDNGQWIASAGSFYRTARRLFDGRVWVPGRAADSSKRP